MISSMLSQRLPWFAKSSGFAGLWRGDKKKRPLCNGTQIPPADHVYPSSPETTRSRNPLRHDPQQRRGDCERSVGHLRVFKPLPLVYAFYKPLQQDESLILGLLYCACSHAPRENYL
jgi:hypothetical protein